MTTPSVLRIERPYASMDAYLEGDAWTVERTDIVLVGIEGPSPGATVKFEIVIADGTPVVVGEGRIVGPVLPEGARRGGVRVRFRQLDAPSKVLLRRALEMQKRAASTRAAEVAAETVVARAPLAPETALTPPVAPKDGPALASTAGAASVAAELTSGVRHRAVGPVAAPGNREALLERLRERTGPRRSGAAE